MRPTIGRIVHYTSKIDNGPGSRVVSPAVIIRTVEDDQVDLCVFGLGKTYREYGVRHGDGLGEWDWPARVDEKGVAHHG